jgi:hypothetical protein
MRIQNKCIAAMAGLLSALFLLMGCGDSDSAESPDDHVLESPSESSPSIPDEYSEEYTIDDAFVAQLRDVAKALSELDYSTAFSIQRSEKFLALMDRVIGGSLPGWPFVYDDESNCSFWGRSGASDSIVSYRPGYPPFDLDEEFDAYRTGEKISSVRRGSASYMFVGNHVKGITEGEYTVYCSRDNKPDTVSIIRLMSSGDIFIGDATVETVTSGQTSDVITTSDFNGCAVPVTWSGTVWDMDSAFWEVEHDFNPARS